MKLSVTQEAVDALKAILKEKEETTKSVRVNIAGFG
jgi:Fe-S cluster assembly iron-binding protein IscA